jgi:hypothetical protein
MSTPDTDLAAAATQDELATLKARADLLGVKYHPSISVDKLRAKVSAALTDDAPKAAGPEEVGPQPPDAVVETAAKKRHRLKQEALKLVRIRVTCMNPAKREWEGEIFTAGNAAVGSVKKFVPFNADEGWHVPHIIYRMLIDRQCQVFVSSKAKNGVTVRQGKMIREFAVEVLPPLTPAELAELARRQAMAHAID